VTRYARFLSPLLFLLLTVSTANALDLYTFASYWNQKDGDGIWGAGLGASLPLLTDRFRLDGRVYGFEESEIDRYADRLDITAFDLGLQVHILPNSTFNPYLLGGLSYLSVDAERLDFDSTLGGYLGGGLEWTPGIPLVRLFAEGLYRFSEIDGDSGKEFDASGLTGNIGLRLHF